MMGPTRMWWLPGAVMIFFGVMIAVFPELLALMVASAFFVLGLGWLSFGWTMRRWEKRSRDTRQVYYYERQPW
jgi:uncharacterized membrane protein